MNTLFEKNMDIYQPDMFNKVNDEYRERFKITDWEYYAKPGENIYVYDVKTAEGMTGYIRTFIGGKPLSVIIDLYDETNNPAAWVVKPIPDPKTGLHKEIMFKSIKNNNMIDIPDDLISDILDRLSYSSRLFI